MASFHDLQTAAPDLADRARAIISSTTNAVLGTLRRDGSPRLSGIDPFFLDGELYIGSMTGALKGQDLRRDPRMSLHSIPWDSRRVRDGADDPGDGDVKLNGTAALVADLSELSAVRQWLKAERGFEPPDSFDLFSLDIESLVYISVVDDLLVVDSWSISEGRRTVRRS